MELRRDYYVYVYIDPRNFEEFYYGKGCGGRKEAHLDAIGDSKKVNRIAAIRKEGEEPIIRVIAKNLSEQEALLIEATLIWKSGDNLTNIAKGHFSKLFRPQLKMHLKLPTFDFQNGIFYVNVSEGVHRCWADCLKYGFVAAGSGRRWSEQIERLNPGDVVCAYCAGRGFVGVGIVKERAVRSAQFLVNGEVLREVDLEAPRMLEHSSNPELAQYLIRVEWKKSVSDVMAAYFRPRAGLYTPQKVVASLGSQPKTRDFIEEVFEVSLDSLALGEE